MQLHLVYDLIRMFAERIVKEVFPHESGAARLQQVGLFTLIFMLQADEEAVTAVRLSNMTGQSQSQIHHQLKKLIKLQLIKRQAIRNKQGRGRAYRLMINHTPQTKRLAEAITRGIVGKAATTRNQGSNPSPGSRSAIASARATLSRKGRG